MESETKQQSALQRNIQRELEWIRMNAKGQQKKGKVRRRWAFVQAVKLNVIYLHFDWGNFLCLQARERAYEELLQKASDYQKADKLESMFMPPGPRLGNVVVEAQALQKGFNDRLLINNLSFSLPPGGMQASTVVYTLILVPYISDNPHCYVPNLRYNH